VRPVRVVARAALIAVLASVAVPAVVGSRAPSAPRTIDSAMFQRVDVGGLGTAVTPPFDPIHQSAGRLDPDGILSEPLPSPGASAAPPPADAQVPAAPIVRRVWHYDPEISWYGPGFYGNRTACGITLTETTIGVAHRTLPCGTVVTFGYAGKTVTLRVIDRGPYVAGRQWDLSHGACAVIDHCWTGPIYWRFG
jgi:hypothetical protein